MEKIEEKNASGLNANGRKILKNIFAAVVAIGIVTMISSDTVPLAFFLYLILLVYYLYNVWKNNIQTSE